MCFEVTTVLNWARARQKTGLEDLRAQSFARRRGISEPIKLLQLNEAHAHSFPHISHFAVWKAALLRDEEDSTS